MHMNTNMRVVVIGCTPMAEKVIHVLMEMPEVTMAGVVNLSMRQGLGKSNYTPMSFLQGHLGARYLEVTDVNAPETLAWIVGHAPAVILQAGWSQIFRSELLQLPSRYCLGLHAAPLPKGRGAAILNWKLLEGGGPWGISLFVMQEKTDTGAVLDFEPFDLEERDDIRMAYFKADRAAVAIIQRTVPLLACGRERLIAQDPKGATRYYSRKPADGRLTAGMTSATILNYVRALTHPYPGAFLDSPWGRLTVWRAQPFGFQSQAEPGMVLAVLPGQGVAVAVADGAVLLTEVTPPDGLTIWCDVWAQEIGLRSGDRLFAADSASA